MSEGPEQRFGRSLAFVVGIDAYSAGIPPLQSAVADATAVAEALRRDHSFETRCLFDHRAGLEDLLAVLADLSRELGPDDRILIYFAGHGVALDGDDGPSGYLLPATARAADRDSFLAMRVLHTELNKLAVRHALVILDCCFAGTFRWSSMRDVATDAPQVYRERYDRYVEAAAWQVLTSTSSRQLALDVLASDRGEQGCTHSPFARALLDGLAGAADYTADNLITASELAMFVRERVEPSVEATGRHQTPQLFTLDRHDHGEFVFQVPGGPLALPPAPTLTEDANPYRGLRSFLEADSDQFFGRGGITHQLVHSISERPLTVVVGPSGCGKSSVVHAGAVPALRANGWSVLATQRPASSPLRALAALAGELRGRPDILDAEPDIAWQEAVALRASEQPDRPWLVIIDQFEELITQRPPRGEYLAVLAALAFALRAAPSLHVVITVRSDVEPQFRESSLADWWSAGRIAIPGMTRDELQDAIERPAASRVLYFEPSRLVDRLIDDVALASAPLPLLSFALSELYRRCWTRWRGGGSDRALRESDYDAMGSVASALTHRATALHDELVQLSPAYGNTVRNVCIRMVAFVHGDLARRRVLGSELVYDDEAENHRVDLVLNRFHDARLISLGSQLTETGQPMSYAEPTHDELIRGWTKVREWLDELEHPIGTRAFVNAIGVATNAWIDSDRAPSYLWTDPRVELAQALHTGRPSLLNAAEAAFVGRSLRRRRSQRRRLVTSVVAVVAVLAVATGVALWQRDRAVSNAVENERLLAQSYQETGRQLVVAENPLQALPYLVAARKAGAAGIPLRTMFHLATRTLPVVTLAHDNAVSLAVYSPDGSLIATASADHRARIWNAATGALARCVLQHGDKVNSVAFSPDGTRLVTASEDGTAQIWDVASGRPLSPPLQHAAAVASAAFSPDGSRVVTASWDSTARVWEAATGLPVGRPIKHAQVVFAAVFSPDGERIATANEGNTARIWDAATGEPRSPPLVHDNSVSSVAFSPDGTRVVTASQDHSARIWDAITGALIHELAHGRAVDAAVFNAQGTRVLTASSDETARIWNVATGALVHELKHKYAVVSAAFSPDGARVVTASADRSARIWDATTGKPLDGPLEHAGTVVSAAFSPDGAHVVTASDDRGARIWNATTGELQFYRLDHRGRVAAAFSPDGTRIVTTGSDHTVRVFSAATGLPLFPPLEHQASNVAARFSPDGTRILAVSQDNTARVWAAATGAPRGPALASPAGIWIAEFSPDGSRVVVASQDNRAGLGCPHGRAADPGAARAPRRGRVQSRRHSHRDLRASRCGARLGCRDRQVGEPSAPAFRRDLHHRIQRGRNTHRHRRGPRCLCMGRNERRAHRGPASS